MLHHHLQLWITLLGFFAIVFAVENVTINNQNPSITYSPPGAWSQSMPSTLDFGGAHMLTQNPNATASFNFTGIAIYFLSPLWPYTVNTAVSIDSGPITLIDLIDHSRPDSAQGPETVQSQVVWNATGLANTQHNLLISVGAGQPYAIVDTLIFTTNTTSITTTSTSSTSSSLSPTPTQNPIIASSTTHATATSTPKSRSRSVVAIALGSLFGVLGVLVIVWGAWYFFRRRKRPASEAWTVDGGSFTTSKSKHPSMSVVGPDLMNSKDGNWSPDQLYNNNNGYSMTRSNDGNTWYNPRYEHVGMPAPPIPSQPYYHGGYQNDINSYGAMQMTGRIPNRYQPGYALSTITERSTPQMGEGKTPPPNSPSSYQSDLEYFTAVQGSETSYSVSRQQQQQPQPQQLQASSPGIQGVPSPNTQGYPAQRRKPVDHNKPAGNWI